MRSPATDDTEEILERLALCARDKYPRSEMTLKTDAHQEVELGDNVGHRCAISIVTVDM